MHGEKVIAELKPIVDEGKCCIVLTLDLCLVIMFFTKIPGLSFSINGKTMTDCKLNHRYPTVIILPLVKKEDGEYLRSGIRSLRHGE